MVLHKLAKEALCPTAVASRLYENVDYASVLIDRRQRYCRRPLVRIGRWRVDSVVNLAKIPIYTWHNLYSRASLTFALMMVPVVVAGNISGIWLVRRIPQHVFEMLIIVLTALSSIALFI